MTSFVWVPACAGMTIFSLISNAHSLFYTQMLTVLSIGDDQRREFEPVLDSLRRLTLWKHSPTVPETPDDDVDLIVFLQSYTKQFPEAAVERLQRRFPLTPMVAVLGPWCAGELRTGSPLVGPFRVFADQWNETELLLLRDGGPSVWTLPSTVGDDEIEIFLAARDGEK